MDKNKNISVIGGAGHVGFPLGLILSSKGYNVFLIDQNRTNINKINSGEPPFMEEKSKPLLKKMIYRKKILATEDLKKVNISKFIIVCIGTPINNKLDPELKNFIYWGIQWVE